MVYTSAFLCIMPVRAGCKAGELSNFASYSSDVRVQRAPAAATRVVHCIKVLVTLALDLLSLQWSCDRLWSLARAEKTCVAVDMSHVLRLSSFLVQSFTHGNPQFTHNDRFSSRQ